MAAYDPRWLLDITFLATFLELSFGPDVDVRYDSGLDLITLTTDEGQEAYVQLVIDDKGPIASVLSDYPIGGDRVMDVSEIGGIDDIRAHFGDESVFKYKLSYRLRDAIAEMAGFEIVHRIDWSTWPMQYILSTHWSYPSTDAQMLDFIREASQDLNYEDLAEAIALGNDGHSVVIHNDKGWVVADKGPFHGGEPPGKDENPKPPPEEE